MEKAVVGIVKLYISNRGEIARRIIRTARRMQIPTCVGYATQDRNLPFVREADEAASLEGEEASSTYLDKEKVIATAKKLGATHLHPGYGFLSENADFVDRLQRAGIEFVGPSAESIRKLGDKMGSRDFLRKLQIPLLPSYEGEDQSESRLIDEAERLGFPILVKPSAGGGGKGMQRIYERKNFLEAIESSKRIAQSAFGDDRIFLERLVAPARHIEVQILGDKYGNIKVLGERECSLQRRHQKVIEECPCIFLSDSLREKIYRASERLAREAGYYSTGTIEWIWDGREGIYFLEVNTRLQVEHPVTELVWKVDLVDWQLRVAFGESVESLSASPTGHAIEARLCAEDPAQDFLPSGGKIHRLSLPSDIRVDFGYAEKDTVSPQFDSLMGKMISSGVDRTEAIQKLSNGLQHLKVMGPTTNRSYLLQLLREPQIVSGDLSTDLIAKIPLAFDIREGFKILSELRNPSPGDEDDVDLYSPWGASPTAAALTALEFEDFSGRRYFHSSHLDWSMERASSRNRVVEDSHSRDIAFELKSPMPGKIVKVFVKEGQYLKKGEVALVMEAMKMEHQMKAPHDVQVAEVLVKEGERVQVETVMVKWANESK